MTEQAVVHALHQIYQIAETGEKGFATAAVNMPNPALKVLFKIYAQQRLAYKNEILQHLTRPGRGTAAKHQHPGNHPSRAFSHFRRNGHRPEKPGDDDFEGGGPGRTGSGANLPARAGKRATGADSRIWLRGSMKRCAKSASGSCACARTSNTAQPCGSPAANRTPI